MQHRVGEQQDLDRYRAGRPAPGVIGGALSNILWGTLNDRFGSGAVLRICLVLGALLPLLALALAAQIGWQRARPPAPRAASDLPPAPSPGVLRLASFGEPAAAARLAMLYVQSFDQRAGNDLSLINV